MVSKTKKYLVLRIYSSSEIYDAMRELHMKYDNSISVVHVPSLEKEWTIDLDEKLIKIRGEETITPGILSKTVKAFEICLKTFEFDILVRSNMSTVIDMAELSSQLANIDGPIYGGHEWFLRWFSPHYNITKAFRDREWGLRFISGTSIVLSRDMCEYIVNHQSELDINMVDDTSIGSLLKAVDCNKFKSEFRENEMNIVKGACFYRFKDNPERMKTFYEQMRKNT